jgi:hypothetical protein
MQNNQLTLNNSAQTLQVREELQGSWYNYEPSVITLDTQEFDHWLSKIDETEFALRPQHSIGR